MAGVAYILGSLFHSHGPFLSFEVKLLPFSDSMSKDWTLVEPELLSRDGVQNFATTSEAPTTVHTYHSRFNLPLPESQQLSIIRWHERSKQSP